MTGSREPVLLAVLIQPSSFCWHVAAIGRGGESVPLVRSEENSLSGYRGLEPVAQRSFLRHSIAGVLQRGCDRLFARNMKAEHFVLIADQHFPEASETLTEQLAEHLVSWMINPPLTYLLAAPGFISDSQAELHLVAGELPESTDEALRKGLPALVAALDDPSAWELIARPPQSP
jgi:hypothetical protein